MTENGDEHVFKKARKLYDAASLQKKVDILSRQLRLPLKHIRGCTYDTNEFRGNVENPIGIIQIPLGIAGPMYVRGKHAVGDFFIPMATTEGALVLTYDLGMRLLKMCSPIEVEVLSKVVHITPMFPIKNDEDVRVGTFVDQNHQKIKQVAERGSKHTKLIGVEKKRVNNNFLLKFLYDTGDAQGLNMINQATFNACTFIEAETGAHFYHRSHYSGVKHHSLLNEEKGYGRVVKASAIITASALEMLGVTARDMKDFCDRCIECGKAAGIGSINVHATNGIAAIFLACGQDAADISSAHVCRGKCELVNNDKDLYWECELASSAIY